MSYKQQMQKFRERHTNESFTATGLARALGWKCAHEVSYQVKDESGKKTSTEIVTKSSHNAKAAVRLAKKCGAQVTRGTTGDGKPVFDIQL